MDLEGISTDGMKEKLRNLKEYMPDQNEVVYAFADYLAGRLNPTLVPAGFNIAAQLALYDLDKGVDGFTGKPILSRLSGYPTTIYAALGMRVPKIAEVVCPEDFAKSVRELHEKVDESLRV